MKWDVTEQQLNKILSHLDPVADQLEDTATQVYDRADRALRIHRFQGDAHVGMEKGKETDWFVYLEDDRSKADYTWVKNDQGKKVKAYGENSALAIEFGRAGYVDQDGETYGQSKGLFILTDAARLPRKRRPTKKLRVRTRGERKRKR